MRSHPARVDCWSSSCPSPQAWRARPLTRNIERACRARSPTRRAASSLARRSRSSTRRRTGRSPTVTNESGAYVFNALAPRPYTLEVELSGFKKAVLDDVRIRAEQANTLDVTLEVGGATETVNVAAAAPLIDTATASVAGTVTAQQIQTMPSAGRDVLQLLQLAPGAFGTGARNTGGTENLPGTTIGGIGRLHRHLRHRERRADRRQRRAHRREQLPDRRRRRDQRLLGRDHGDHAERGRDQGSEGHHQQLRRRERPLSWRAGADHLAERDQRSPWQRVLQGQPARPERLSELQRLWPRGAEGHRVLQRHRRHGRRTDPQEQAVRVLLLRDDPQRRRQHRPGLVSDAAVHGASRPGRAAPPRSSSPSPGRRLRQGRSSWAPATATGARTSASSRT